MAGSGGELVGEVNLHSENAVVSGGRGEVSSRSGLTEAQADFTILITARKEPTPAAPMNTPLGIPTPPIRSTEVVPMGALSRNLRSKPAVGMVCWRCGKVAEPGSLKGWLPVAQTKSNRKTTYGICPTCVDDRFTFSSTTDA